MIRDFEEKDYDTFVKLIDAFYHSEAVLHPVPTEHYAITFKHCIEKSPYVRGLVYEVNGETVGFALLSFAYSNEAGGIVVWIEEIYIYDKFRGMGYGTKLMQFIHDEYKDKAKRFRLEVTHENTGASNLYKKLGYEFMNYLQMTRDI